MPLRGLVPRTPNPRELVGEVANQYAAQSLFSDYQSRKSQNTLKRQRSGLRLFREYLSACGVEDVGDLAADPLAWRTVTWGLLQGFIAWQLQRGYAVSSINVRLSTIKTYAKMATQAGAIATQDYAMIRLVSGYSGGEARHVDEKREDAGIPTRYQRVGAKKAEPVILNNGQIRKLKERPDDPQGRRDRVMLGLMLDLGLRVGEVALLDVSNVNLETGDLTFYRPKVDRTQTHSLDKTDLLDAINRYMELDALLAGPLLRSSQKDGSLLQSGMSERAITARVRTLGQSIGVEGLSAHDLRHTWATRAAQKTRIDRLMEAGGWTSPAMPLRYIEASKIANEGVSLE
jgi:integrase